MDDYPDKVHFTRTREDTALARKLRREASKTERRLWPRVRSSQMGAPFRRQYRVTRHFADYCCVPLKLVVEIDGPTHDAVADSIRDQRINDQGFDVLRFSVQEIDGNLDGVVETIYREVQIRLLARRVGEAG